VIEYLNGIKLQKIISEMKSLIPQELSVINVHIDNDKPLRQAVNMKDAELVKLLIAQKANINVNEGKPLRQAVKKGYVDIAKILIDAGADIHVRKDAPLRKALLNAGMLQLLKNYGQLTSNAYVTNGKPLLCKAIKSYNIELVKLLIAQGVDLNVNEGKALRFAVKRKYDEIVKILIEAGADIHVRNDAPLRKASHQGTEILKLLLKF